MIRGGSMEIKEYTRKSLMVDLKDFCVFAKKDHHIEVTEWSNLEGFDVVILSSSGEKSFSLTDGEFEALQFLIKDMRG